MSRGKTSGKRKNGARSQSPDLARTGPRLGRQLIYAGMTLAAVLVGYWAGATSFGNKALPWISPQKERSVAAKTERISPPAPAAPVPATDSPESNLQAWYTSHQPPPLIRAPDTPLFPDAMDDGAPEEPLRAYEEALPEEVHAPRTISLPMPPPVIPPAPEEESPKGTKEEERRIAPTALEITVVQPPEPEAPPPRPDLLNAGSRGGLTPPPMPAATEEPAEEEPPPPTPVAVSETKSAPEPEAEAEAEPAPTPEPGPEVVETPPTTPPSMTLTVTRHPTAEAPPYVAPATSPDPEAAMAEALAPLPLDPPAPESAPKAETEPEPVQTTMVAEPAIRLPEAPAWRQYAVAAPTTADRPMIAVVIDDMGIDRRRSDRVVALEGPLTLSYLTYARELRAQALEARIRGHELMLHVPMEPSNQAIDPGPNVLLTDLPHTDLRTRLDWALGRFEGFVGINNHMGSKFTADPTGMTVVMEALRDRGLLFLDSRTTGATQGAVTALRAGVPFVERNVFLDNVNDVAAVNDRLADLEDVAARHGFAVGIGHPRDATIEALSEWVWGMSERGFVLVPLTTIVERLQETG